MGRLRRESILGGDLEHVLPRKVPTKDSVTTNERGTQCFAALLHASQYIPHYTHTDTLHTPAHYTKLPNLADMNHGDDSMRGLCGEDILAGDALSSMSCMWRDARQSRVTWK